MIALITTSALVEARFNRAVEIIFIDDLYGVAASAGSTADWGGERSGAALGGGGTCIRVS